MIFCNLGDTVVLNTWFKLLAFFFKSVSSYAVKKSKRDDYVTTTLKRIALLRCYLLDIYFPKHYYRSFSKLLSNLAIKFEMLIILANSTINRILIDAALNKASEPSEHTFACLQKLLVHTWRILLTLHLVASSIISVFSASLLSRHFDKLLLLNLKVVDLFCLKNSSNRSIVTISIAISIY